MFTIKALDDQIIEVSASGDLDYQDWIEYQEIMLSELDQSDQKLYILSNFSHVTRFDPKIAKEAGTAKHLIHPNLGLIVLLGGNTLMNFVLQLAENRAQHEEKSTRLRVHREYDRAIDVLLHQRNIENI